MRAGGGGAQRGRHHREVGKEVEVGGGGGRPREGVGGADDITGFGVELHEKHAAHMQHL